MGKLKIFLNSLYVFGLECSKDNAMALSLAVHRLPRGFLEARRICVEINVSVTRGRTCSKSAIIVFFNSLIVTSSVLLFFLDFC